MGEKQCRETINMQSKGSVELSIWGAEEIESSPVVDSEMFVYPWCAGKSLPHTPGSLSRLEYTDDIDPIRHQERVPQ